VWRRARMEKARTVRALRSNERGLLSTGASPMLPLLRLRDSGALPNAWRRKERRSFHGDDWTFAVFSANVYCALAGSSITSDEADEDLRARGVSADCSGGGELLGHDDMDQNEKCVRIDVVRDVSTSAA